MELGDDPPRVRTPDYCSARDYHVSTSLRGEGRRGGRVERGKEEREEEVRGEKGGRREGRKGEGGGREMREGRKGEGGRRGVERSDCKACAHTHTHTLASFPGPRLKMSQTHLNWPGN